MSKGFFIQIEKEKSNNVSTIKNIYNAHQRHKVAKIDGRSQMLTTIKLS